VPTRRFVQHFINAAAFRRYKGAAMTARTVHVLLALAVIATLSACSGKKRVDWKEEVLLIDGSIIVIERAQEYRRVGEPGAGTGWLFDSASFTARLPSRSEAIAWNGTLQPLVFDTDKDAQPYLLATVETRRGRQDYSVAQSTRYVAFKYEDQKWIRIPLDAFPEKLRPNLLASTWELFIRQQEPSGAFVRISAKQNLDARATLPEHYKRLGHLK
jgi:hypothetical protein